MKRIAGMATMAGREKQLKIAIESLVNQVDEIIIYNNKELPNKADNGKFFGLTEIKEPCYYFTCDDDIKYPDDYIEKMVEAIDKHGCIITHHGRILQKMFVSYYRGHRAFMCLRESTFEGQIDVSGTGVTAFRTDYFNPTNLHNAKDRRMSDIVFSLEAMIQNKKIMIMPHKEGWLKQIPLEGGYSIHEDQRRREGRQIQLANRILSIKNRRL